METVEVCEEVQTNQTGNDDRSRSSTLAGPSSASINPLLPPVPVPVFSEETQAILRELVTTIEASLQPLGEGLSNISRYLQKMTQLMEERRPRNRIQNKSGKENRDRSRSQRR